MRHLFLLVVMLAFIGLAPVPAIAAEREADHEALRAVLATSTEAINKANLDLLKPVLAKNLTIITVDNHKLQSLDEFKAYWDGLFHGGALSLERVEVAPSPDGLTEFLGGDVGYIDGTSKDVYHFKSGSAQNLTVRWSAVVEKEDGQWKIAKIHFSADILDNPILSIAKQAAGGNMLLPALAGFAIGALLIGMLCRKKTA